MKKKHLPIFTFIGIATLVLIFSFISFIHIYDKAKEELFESQLQSGEREAREIGKLLEQQLKSGLSEEQVINNLQSSIINTDVQTEFICMYNRKGIELCHPNPALVGQVIDGPNSLVTTWQGKQGDTFLEWLQKGESQNGIRSFPNSKRPSEIVNVYPVKQTDWMVALHVNMQVLTSRFSNLYTQFFLIFLISALFLIGCCYAIVRLIYRKYERSEEAEKGSLNKEIDSLSLLNQHLNESQKRLQNELFNLPASANQDAAKAPKKRLITYQRDELIKLEVDNIAFIFLKTGMTYLQTFDNLSYTTNESLDEIMNELDAVNFYRANRQVIVNIRAIQTIQLYGSNQLKLIIKPATDIEILVSKNKVAEFKQWLNQ